MRNHEGNKTGRQGGSGDRDPKDAIMKGDQPAFIHVPLHEVISTRAVTVHDVTRKEDVRPHDVTSTGAVMLHASCMHARRRATCYMQKRCHATWFLHAQSHACQRRSSA